jgi:hypothetical protein
MVSGVALMPARPTQAFFGLAKRAELGPLSELCFQSEFPDVDFSEMESRVAPSGR